MKARIRKIDRALQSRFGKTSTAHEKQEPVDNLILTILSQNTNDRLRDRAYISLKKTFPSHEAILRSPSEEVEQSIQMAGLSKQKTETIQRVLSRLRDDRGTISLDFLENLTTTEGLAYLKGIKGIGDKTASIVLLFSFNRSTFPVDTHIQRVSKRIGIVRHNASPEKIRLQIEPHVEGGRAKDLHINLISLGKELCKPKNPLCQSCPLLPFCDYGRSNKGEDS